MSDWVRGPPDRAQPALRRRRRLRDHAGHVDGLAARRRRRRARRGAAARLERDVAQGGRARRRRPARGLAGTSVTGARLNAPVPRGSPPARPARRCRRSPPRSAPTSSRSARPARSSPPSRRPARRPQAQPAPALRRAARVPPPRLPGAERHAVVRPLRRGRRDRPAPAPPLRAHPLPLAPRAPAHAPRRGGHDALGRWAAVARHGARRGTWRLTVATGSSSARRKFRVR